MERQRSKIDLYERYTSSMLLDKGEESVTKWDIGNFGKNVGPHLPADRGARILEVGCGYGRNIKALHDLGYMNVTGVDISEEQVLQATRTLGLANIYKRDAFEFLREQQEDYDTVLVLDMLEHLDVEDSIEILQLVKRALKSGGTLIISVPNALAPMSPYPHGDITHKRAYTVPSLKQSLILGGFPDSHIRFYDFPPYVDSLKSGIKRTLWSLVLRPAISAFMFAAYGNMGGGIYTFNILAVARK